jgi:predicted nucleotidyltransferase
MVVVGVGDSLSRLRVALAARPVPGVAAAYVFGSMAEGREHRESDIDLGVLFDRQVYPDERSRFEAQVELRRHLSPASVGRDVDIVVLNDASPVLGRQIVRGERVFCADREIDHAFRRDVQLRAADLEPFLQKMRRRLHANLTR